MFGHLMVVRRAKGRDTMIVGRGDEGWGVAGERRWARKRVVAGLAAAYGGGGAIMPCVGLGFSWLEMMTIKGCWRCIGNK